MLKIILTLLIFIFSSKSISSEEPQKKNDDIRRFVFSLSAMNTTSVDDAHGISRVLVDQIKQRYKRVDKTEVLICKDSKEILEKSKNGFDLMILSPNEFLTLRKQLPLHPMYVSSNDGTPGFKYLLIVNKSDSIINIEQLAGSDLLIYGRERQQTPELILDHLLRVKKLPKKESFFRSINVDPVIAKVVLPVFFKKSKAAIVTEESFKLISEINPQLDKELRVIFKSPNYIFAVACLNLQTKDPELRKIFLDILGNLHTEPFGRQLLDLFRVEKLIPYKEEYLTEYMKLYD